VLAIIVLGGDYDPPVRLDTWRSRAEIVIAADGGAVNALNMGIIPDLAVGDFDSLPFSERQRLDELGIQVETHPRQKDETDAELAIRAALARGADELVVLCPFGGRIDHTLANVLLLAHPDVAGRTIMAAGRAEIVLIRDEASFFGKPGDLLSLLPLGSAATGIHTQGLQYQLDGDTLQSGFARGMSNVFTAQRAAVVVQTGQLLAIHTRQR